MKNTIFKLLSSLLLITFLGVISCTKNDEDSPNLSQESKLNSPRLLFPVNGAKDIENNKESVLKFTPAKWADKKNTSVIIHDLYFGTNETPPKFKTMEANDISISSLKTEYNTKYYWKIVAHDGKGIELSNSEVWSFLTKDINSNDRVFVKGGTFQMGNENDDYKYNEPVHAVTVSDFYIGKYEVTNSQFAAFLNSEGNKEEGGKTWLNIKHSSLQIEIVDGVFKVKEGKDNYPVSRVTWYGAKAYAFWVGGRLPSEAEWEYAARGGVKSKGYTYSGSNVLSDVAVYNGRKEYIVGTKQANELGIYDMSGNVWEWCNDGFSYYTNDAKINPKGDSTSDVRILRGGSSYDPANRCDVTFRENNFPYYEGRNHNIGFRVVFPSK